MKKMTFALLVLLLLVGTLVACAEASMLEEAGQPEDTETDTYDASYTSLRTEVVGILADPGREWDSILVRNLEGVSHTLSAEDTRQVFEILSTMDATEVLTPTHMESQQSDPVFVLETTYADGGVETIFTTETGIFFFRFTDTYGDQGDPGYVGGVSEALFDILSAYF